MLARFAGFEVSIHAPARGATLYILIAPHGGARFNPRSRAGSDIEELSVPLINGSFNPRSRAGSDGGWVLNCKRY